jgi:hypothetical protein
MSPFHNFQEMFLFPVQPSSLLAYLLLLSNHSIETNAGSDSNKRFGLLT